MGLVVFGFALDFLAVQKTLTTIIENTQTAKPLKTSYMVQNLKGDGMETWYAWAPRDNLDVHIVGENNFPKEKTDAIKKATGIARKSMVKVDVTRGTILHTVKGKFSASHVLLKPALTGTGIIASSPVRAVCEAVGIRNILTKSLGSNNPTNLAWATIDALQSVRPVAVVAEMRNKPVEYFTRKRHEENKSNPEEKSNKEN